MHLKLKKQIKIDKLKTFNSTVILSENGKLARKNAIFKIKIIR